MRQIWVIVFLLIIASRVVAMMIERANKKQQEQRMREAALRRQRQHAPPLGQAQAQAEPAPGRFQQAPQQYRPSPAVTREQELAARRKAQLEELRRRRQVRVTGPQGAPGALGGTGAPGAPARPLPAPSPVRRQAPPTGRPVTRPTSAPPTRPSWPAPILGRDRPVPQTTRAAAAARAQPAAAAAPRPEPEVAAHPAVQKPKDSAYEAAAKQRTARSFLFGDAAPGTDGAAAALRRLVVLKEVLDPPVAMRRG